MSLSTAELEELLRLALAALRVQAGAPVAAVVAQALPEPVSDGLTMAEWKTVDHSSPTASPAI